MAVGEGEEAEGRDVIGFLGCLILKTTIEVRKMTARIREIQDFTSDLYSAFFIY